MILYYLSQAYGFVLFLGIIFSWLSLTDNRFVLAVRNASEWYLGPFRGLIVVGSVDLSVLLAMIIYEGITGLLIGIPFI
ncbi:MAG TPA: YggT family protein [Bacilli bacterium]|nr:YggT family protein [Bacilli bacterium]HPN61137.1 YggT family protein [Bacilli bacterium]HPX84767.1 YggT family protein [Bacilli bacterium]HQC74963.1 YggT family protein [Bacilli bacterium]